jgi:Holliday junction resolvase-like predicted endonuclease
MRRAAKVDRNHAEIVDVLRSHGADVLDMSRIGQGCPDLAVHLKGTIVFVEVKAGKGKLTADQVVFHQRWPVRVLRSRDEAIQMIGALRGNGE